MRAYRSQGPVMVLQPQDAIDLESGKKLECILAGTTIRLRLTLQNDVKSKALEEPGFHLIPYPKNSGYDDVKCYDIYITPRVLAKTQTDDCFISRCRADRATIHYYDFTKNMIV